MTTPVIEIPENLKPADGRFGAGPSKVSAKLSQAVAAAGSDLLGTSHRQPPVRNLVASVQEGITQLFSAPEDYQVVLGVGGATDRKSTRLNSSHVAISYAVFCLKKKIKRSEY